MKIQSCIPIVLLSASILCPHARGQEVSDLFDMLDKQKVAEETTLSKLRSNLGGSFTVRGQHFLSDPEESSVRSVDDSGNPIESRLNLSTWTGTNTWRLSASGWLEWGNEDIWKQYSHFDDMLQDTVNQRRYTEINELYLRLYRDNYDISIGKSIFKNGIAPLYSPADRYGPSDYNDPIEPRELGYWLVQTDAYIKNVTVTGALFPVYQFSKIPSDYSRWMADVGSNLGSDSERIPVIMKTATLDDIVPAIRPENFSYLLRAKSTARGWDVFCSAFYGLNSQYVYTGADTTIRIPVPRYEGYVDIKSRAIDNKLVRVGHLSTGFSTTSGKWEFHGEGLYNYSFKSKDDDFISYVLGFSYNIGDLAHTLLLNSVVLYIDYAGESVTKKQSAENYIISSRDMRFGGKDFLIGENDLLTVFMIQAGDNLDVNLISLRQLSKDGGFLRLMGRYKIRNDVFANLSYDRFSGSESSFLGRWDANDRFTASCNYTF